MHPVIAMKYQGRKVYVSKGHYENTTWESFHERDSSGNELGEDTLDFIKLRRSDLKPWKQVAEGLVPVRWKGLPKIHYMPEYYFNSIVQLAYLRDRTGKWKVLVDGVPKKDKGQGGAYAEANFRDLEQVK